MSHPVRCLYVSPNPDPEEEAAIRKAWDEMRAWLRERVPQTLDLEELGVVRATQPVTPDTCWGLAWGLAKLPGHHLFIMKGAGAWAGSNTAPQGGGVGVVGDAVIDEIVGREPSACKRITGWGAPQCSRDGQIGAALHELLHTFGLRHEDGGIMSEWWDWPRAALPQGPFGGKPQGQRLLDRILGAFRRT